ncbi:MAG: nucleoid-associated protein [Bacteroidota bacterium]
MEIHFTSLHQIDHALDSVKEVDIRSQGQDLTDYTKRLITEITEGTSKRKFRFKRDTTEVRGVIADFITGNYEGKEINAKRLMDVEQKAQEAIAHLNKEIQKGSLFQAHLQNGKTSIVVISKADQQQFLSNEDFNLKSGLPWEKKIFKAFLARIEGNNVVETFVYDTSARLATYWWDKFLELEEVYTSSFNTKTALKLLDSKVLNSLKKKFKADHTSIRNKVVGYFQSQPTFEMQTFLETVITEYQPISADFPKTKTIEKIKDLPDKYSFDSQFPIAPEEVKARKIRNNIPLSDGMDLVLKQNIPELDSTVNAFADEEGRKYIAIRTDSGYEYFKSKDEVSENNQG